MYVTEESNVFHSHGNSSDGEVGNTVINVISACLWLVSTLLILVLNTMCLVILHKVKGLSKPTVVFLKSMTIADIILGLTFYMPTVGVFIAGRQWIFGDVFCQIQAWGIRAALPMTGLSVLLVTVDRYIAIVYPMKYKKLMSVCRARIITCTLWIAANLYGLLTSIWQKWEASFSQYYFICTIGKYGDTKAGLILIVMSVILFVMIIAMYVRILRIAQRHAAQIAKHRPSITSAISNEEQQSNPSPNRKSFTTIFIITMTLLIGWLPSLILGFTTAAKKPPISLVIATQIPLASVSWLNVIVYYMRNQAIQETGRELYLQILGFFKGCCKK